MSNLFAPLSSSFLGYDSFFHDIDRLLTAAQNSVSTGYPPLNLYKEEGGYLIEIALAGYKKDDIKIEHDRKSGVLTITGEVVRKQPEATSTSTAVVVADRTPIKQGIAARKFTRSFTIADDLEVESATLEDGLLTIKVKEVVREEHKPVLIPIA